MSNRQERRQRRYLVETDEHGVTHVLADTGSVQRVDGDSMSRKFEGVDIAKLPPGEHLWAVFTMYRYNPRNAGPMILDMENLLQVGGIGCYVCEQPYSPDLLDTPCPGEPS